MCQEILQNKLYTISFLVKLLLAAFSGRIDIFATNRKANDFWEYSEFTKMS